MAGPWEAYQQKAEAPAGPWTAYQPRAEEPAPDRGTPKNSVFANIETGIRNTVSGLEQGTTPNIGAQEKNLLGEGTVDEEGNLLIKGPNGQLIPTDQKQHVALRDPATGKVQVFNRTPETNEGALTGISRVAMTGMGAGALPGKAAAGAVAAARPVAPVVEAGQRLGVEVPRVVASDSRLTQMTGQGLQQLPFSGNRIAAKVGQTVDQLGGKVGDVAEGFGGAATPVGAGQQASTAITDWITGASKANVSKAYGKVDELVNPTVTAPLAKTRQAVSEIGAKRDLAAMAQSDATKPVLGALERPEGLTYEGIKTLRTSIGEMLDTGILPPNISKQELSKLYGGLSDDLRVAARAAGGEAGLSAFERANKLSRLTSERRENLAKIVGGKGDASPERVFDRLYAMAGSTGRADIGRLNAARKVMGAEDWNGFVSGVVTKLGGEEFSPLKFLTAYNKLTPDAKSVLFKSGGKGELGQHLEDIATISAKWKQFDKLGNPSGTARNTLGPLGGLAVVTGHIEPLTAITGLVGGRVAARILSNPATAASTSQWSRAYAKMVQTPNVVTAQGFARASQNLSTNLADKLGVTLDPASFFKAVQGGVRAPAQDEQPQPPGVVDQ